MTQADMLNEHLNVIYIIEELNFSKLKSKAKEIGNAISSGNIIRVKRVFDNIPDISLDQLKSLARKKSGVDYKKNEKYTDMKLKKVPDKIKDSMTLIRTSLLRIKSDTKDPEVQSKLGKAIEDMDEIYKRIVDNMSVLGLTLVGVAVILFFLFGLFPALIALTIGTVFLWVAIITFVVGILVALFVDAKKEGKKVIS